MDEKQRDNEDGKPVWQASGHERQVDADAYHIWTPRPLIRSVYWRPEPEPPREAVAGSYEVFLDQRVFAAMHEHVWNAGVGRSQFGYLIGDLCEDPSASRRFVIITAAAPSRFPFLEAGPEQIPAEASVALQLEVERRRGVLVGWYHSHPAGDARLSPEDVATHEQLFPESWQVAFLFVTDPDAPAGACFRRTPEGFDGETQLPFYEIPAC
ncbi:MAG: Mov34/MPN/PAD-1 family protein [Gemmatimonadota bacterium]